ncbi:hypothetical protein C4K23_2290 [Pseudomonas chlororaphis]|nr:hypothetical protein C4K23_2290 [Pseudomonas chlororaphis]
MLAAGHFAKQRRPSAGGLELLAVSRRQQADPLLEQPAKRVAVFVAHLEVMLSRVMRVDSSSALAFSRRRVCR